MEDLRRQEVRELARMTAHLDPAQQQFFQFEYGRHRRNPTTALLLCTLLGGFGAHYFYFGRHRAGMTRLLFCWTLIPAILALFDAHTMSARTMRYNASLASELLLAIKGAVEEDASQARRLIASSPLPLPQASEPVAIAAPAEPAGRVLMDATWAEPTFVPAPADSAGVPEPHTAFAPLAAAGVAGMAALGGAAVAAHAHESHWSRPADDTAYSASNASAPLADPALETAAAPSDEVDSAYAPAWPNDMARPVWPVARKQVNGAVEPEPPIWPVPAALLATPVEPYPTVHGQNGHDAYASQNGYSSQSDPYARYTRADAADAWDANGYDDPHAGMFTAATPASAASAAGAVGAFAAHDAGATEAGVHDDAAGTPVADAAPAVDGMPVRMQYALPGPFLDGAGYGTNVEEMPASPPAGPPASSEPAPPAYDQREPVFMYQVAPAPRREAAHMEPPLAEYQSAHMPADDDVAFPWAARMPVLSNGHANGQHPTAPAPEEKTAVEHGAISALGSALAFGLADLLRERTRATRPITQPRTAETMPVYDLPRQPLTETSPPVVPGEPSNRSTLPSWLLDMPMSSATEPTPPPAMPPAPVPHAEPPAWQPYASDSATMPQATSAPWTDPSAALGAGVLLGAGGIAGAGLYREHAVSEAIPAPVSSPLPQTAGVAAPTSVPASVPAASAPGEPGAPRTRRRLVQRVIVRKMAVLDGQVVAESTVERQVPVVADDHEMSQRIQQATLDASREALNYLLMQAPDEARPSIRQQLYDLRAS